MWGTTTALATALLAAGVLIASGGAIDTLGADPGAVALPAAPAWAAPCHGREPRHDRELLRQCARVRGRVVAVKREASLSGAADLHLAVIARFHLFIVKLGPAQHRPSVGATVSVVGPLVRGSNGLREIDAVRVTLA